MRGATLIGLCSAFVLAATWLVASGSGLALSVSYVASGLALLLAAAMAWPRSAAVSQSMWVGWLLAGLPLVWLALRVVAEPVPAAAARHQAELLGGVLPGLVFGLLTALAVSRRMHAAGALLTREATTTARATLVLALLVCAVAVYLLANVEDDILLVSVALLVGAEAYQILGDALTVALLAVVVLAGLDARSAPAAARRLRPLALSLLGAGTLACAVLVGSNKLLLVCGVVLLASLASRLFAGRQPLRRAVVWTGVGLVAALALWLVVVEDAIFAELLALTRLLDYGNVESLLDAPSIASRVEIFEDCAAEQFGLSPLLGDLAAEFRTCGDGHYVHSLLSVQSHLGAVGSVLFAVLLGRAALLMALQPGYHPLWLPWAVILGVGFVGAYFTWLPFWYLVGLMAVVYRGAGPASDSSAQTCASTSHGPALRA